MMYGPLRSAPDKLLVSLPHGIGCLGLQNQNHRLFSVEKRSGPFWEDRWIMLSVRNQTMCALLQIQCMSQFLDLTDEDNDICQTVQTVA